MAQIAKKYQDELCKLKDEVRESYKYFHHNREYFNTTRKFVLQGNLSSQDKSNLQALNRPPLEFNVLEAYVSRLLGEFSKQEPCIEVFSSPSDNPPDPDMVDYVEGHMRSIFQDFDRYEIYRDCMTGGYSAIKLGYEYENYMSFNHKICATRVYDPLLVGWDPSAREKHKGDGDYCYEFYPKTMEELEEMGYEVKDDKTNVFVMDDIKWTYKIGGKTVKLVCDLYKKKRKRIKIYRLADNTTKTEKQYKEMLDYYEKNKIEQPPTIIQQRYSMQDVICRYMFTESELLEYSETDFSILPIIFVDGNSALIREDNENSDVKQITKSYIHNAMDAQRLKNMTGQQLAHSIETMVEHKMKIALESIPKGYDEAYYNVQYPGNYVFKAYNDQGMQLPAPQEVMKMPLPQEVVNTFNGAEQLIQNILGNYDASLGINNNQLSGIAIVEGATQSNATAMPFIVNLLCSLEHLANGILDLIPKLYVTPRSIPIITAENKRHFVLINTNNVPQDGKKYKNTKPIKMSFSSSDLSICVKPGVNFEIQQQRALETMIKLMPVLPSFANIMNGKGLPIILDNLQIRGADRLKVLAEEQVAQQQKAPPQMNPAMLKIQLDQKRMTLENQIKQAELELKQQELQDERFKVAADLVSSHQDNVVQMEKAKTEREVHHVNTVLKTHDQLHRHASDAMDHAKDLMSMAQNDQNNEIEMGAQNNNS